MGRKDTVLRPRLALLVLIPAALLLAGCSRDTQLGRFGLLEPASDRAPAMGDLYFWYWVVALAIGVFVWGLIFWAAFRYRRRKGSNNTPRQTRYNLPMEVLYTTAPLLIVAVLFVFTSRTEQTVLAKEPDPDHIVDVVGYKWSWGFNYLDSKNGGTDVYEAGTVEKRPVLYLPLDESVRFNLESPDVIHSFWIPEFYFKLDVIPGRKNSFDVTPTREGVFIGKCAELCGTYHAAMLFEVRVVSKAEYQAQLQRLEQAGQTGRMAMPTGIVVAQPSGEGPAAPREGR